MNKEDYFKIVVDAIESALEEGYEQARADERERLNEEDLKERAEMLRLLDKAYLLIYNNPMTSKDYGAGYADALNWVNKYKAIKNPGKEEYLRGKK